MTKKDTLCPLLLTGWISRYGAYETTLSNGWHDYCHCGTDCEWFDEDSNKCIIHQITKKED